MQMTKADIIAEYKQAKDKVKQVSILAQLNACPVSEIKAVLYEAGLIDAELVVPRTNTRNRMAWLPEDDEAIRGYFTAGTCDKEIAAALGRTTAAVSERRRVLGLLRERYKTPTAKQVAAPVEDIAAVAEAAPVDEAAQVVETKPAELPKITGTTLAAVDVTPAARRAAILDRAKECVCTDRNAQYGEPEDNFAVIADLWAPYIKARCVGKDGSVDVGPYDVAMMMVLLKVGRAATAIEACDDTLVDIAGYAACAAGME